MGNRPRLTYRLITGPIAAKNTGVMPVFFCVFLSLQRFTTGLSSKYPPVLSPLFIVAPGAGQFGRHS